LGSHPPPTLVVGPGERSQLPLQLPKNDDFANSLKVSIGRYIYFLYLCRRLS